MGRELAEAGRPRTMCEGVDKSGLGGWLGGRMRRTQEVQGGGVKGIRKTIGQEGGETQ
jgi:hypothetical protein